MEAIRLHELAQPLIYEINTWVWLEHLTSTGDQRARVDLGAVPDEEWDAIAAMGVDAVWLMGVWERSPAGVAIAAADAGLMDGFRRALPDMTADDLVGSPYAVRRYVVDPRLGGPEGLAVARAALARRGVGLLLDHVPNHVATDHPWAHAHPEYFIGGDADDLRRDPGSWHEVAGRVLAHGRDPYFPAWTDTLQLNAFAPALREATVETLRDIGDQCDGVRCDMAMLAMTDVFAGTWGDRAGARPDREFWAAVLPAVRERHPGFVCIAEAYWDTEWALQQQGFDHCYDKRLYDRLLHADASQVAAHLALADVSYQRRLVRFVENHDEPRVASAQPAARARAAAVGALTQVGARLVHQGQREGRTVRLPVQLGRWPDEPVDDDTVAFYDALLAVLDDPTLRSGRWRWCEVRPADTGDPGGVLAWTWEGDTRWLIVVNLGDAAATARVVTPWTDAATTRWWLRDALTGDRTARDGHADGDVVVALEAWGARCWRVEALAELDGAA